MLDFSLPKFDSEEKTGPGQGIISLNRLLVNATVTPEMEMEGTAQFKKDKIESCRAESPRENITISSPDQEKRDRSQSEDTVQEVNLFDKEKLQQHIEAKDDSRASSPSLAKKSNSFKAKVKAIVALTHKKKTPLEVKP